MNGRVSFKRNARVLKALSLLYLGLIGISLVLVHRTSYEPAVSYIPLYLTVSVVVTVAVALLLLPAQQFSKVFSTGAYVFFAASLAAAVFFTGGASSELYILFFPLLLASTLHRSWHVAIAGQVATLVSYALSMLPDVLGIAGAPSLVLFRLAVFMLVGAFALMLTEENKKSTEDRFTFDPDGSVLLERVTGELSAHRGVPVAVVLVDPGREVEDKELLLERVRSRIGDPVLLGEGLVFGIVLSGADDRTVESAARRALSATSSLGARETRAGAAIYPRDARTPGELLVAAGQALEAAFDIESPSAIVLAGRGTESHHRVAR